MADGGWRTAEKARLLFLTPHDPKRMTHDAQRMTENLARLFT